MIVGLGNPGPEYDDTRHNVGWWVVDRLAYDWGFESFEKKGRGLQIDGHVDDRPARLLKPTTFMNKSGEALISLAMIPDFDFTEDLLVVSDDATLDVGRVRFRPRGGAGGHNGLKSIASALGTDEYARLRVGVGQAPGNMDLADWVLSPMKGEDEDVVVGLLPDLTRAVETWMSVGTEEAMNECNQ